MEILSKIVLTLVILLITSGIGLSVTNDSTDGRHLRKWAIGFAISMLIEISGLILCVIAYVWV